MTVQSVSAAQGEAHAVLPALQAKRPHEVVGLGKPQAPAPLQVFGPEPAVVQAAPEQAGSAPPLGTKPQVPSAPVPLRVARQERQVPHAESQQTPSVQKPDAQSVAREHAPPFAWPPSKMYAAPWCTTEPGLVPRVLKSAPTIAVVPLIETRAPNSSLAAPSPPRSEVKFPRVGGQSDYAASSSTRAFNSNVMGLT